MTRRAVLIGAQTQGLRGVHADVELMSRLLGGRGFTSVRVHVGEDAGYHGIVEALARLGGETEDGDSVVVYYSGHGALADGLQFLVPVDIALTTPTDFRGYLAEELTAALRVLARVTRNITCVLDCCHSGGMLRDSDAWRLKSRALPRLPTDAGRERAGRHPADPLVPGVVRLPASQRYGSAYEAPSLRGSGSHGLFTEALAEVLDATMGRPVPWSMVISRVRDVLKQRVPQWPDAGGPSGRLPFSLETPVQPERLPLARSGGRLVVPGAAVFGIGPQDRMRVVLPDDGGPECVVESVDHGDAVLGVPGSSAGAAAELPPGACAVPVLVHDRRLVHLDALPPGPFADALVSRIQASPRLTETHWPAHAFAAVRLRDDGTAEVVNPDGLAHRQPVRPTEDSAHDLAALLETLARGERVRQLRDPVGNERLDAEADVRFERIPTGPQAAHALRPEGELLYDRDRYRITVANRSSRNLYLWVLGVGLSGRTDLVTEDQPSGIALKARGTPHGDSVVIGPVEVYWPAEVPRTGRRPETVHLLVGDRPLDLGPLAARDGAGRTAPFASGATTSSLLQEIRHGLRDQRRSRSEEFRHRLYSVHALVEPRERESWA